MIESLVASGRVVDVVLAFMLLEALALGVYRARTARGIALPDLAINLLAGVGLLVALRAALTGTGWQWIAGGLFAALFAHAADLARRWRS